ncbi:hypothetical protein DFJ74DRAFT_650427 [Hyaloraphidium curvatum]|nr:hypothetical protein DFJ74DRAFT_650427 [Hyaloraphidium curvatum]
MRETATHVFFWRTADVFSQWHPSPFTHADTDYPTAEHFMMATKALLFKDLPSFLRITQTESPEQVKKLGRGVRGFDARVWDDNKFETVVLGNYLKFSQNPGLRAALLATGDKILVEASPVDRIWGIGLAEDDPDAEDEAKWKGENLLGKALMRVRADLKWEAEQEAAEKADPK